MSPVEAKVDEGFRDEDEYEDKNEDEDDYQCDYDYEYEYGYEDEDERNSNNRSYLLRRTLHEFRFGATCALTFFQCRIRL